jgi:lipopolysaccharide/colanic/teichoic acid biosynthesis glycosyltransferase
MKRVFDVVMSFLALLFFFPVLFLISVLVKATSKGPVIFTQKRVGIYGSEFTIYKFRTMKDKSGKSLDLVRRGDSRITTVGKFLRSTHLDELPQFWNVLKGDMSIVGPRPTPTREFQEILAKMPKYVERLSVRPGITSPVQILGRDWWVKNISASLVLEIEHMRKASIFFDLKIIIQTVLTMIRLKGE